MRPLASYRRRFQLALAIASGVASPGMLAANPPLSERSNTFDRNPGWEEFNNRVVLKSPPTVVQDFGHAHSQHAGKARGELGGRVTRSNTPAYYAAKIAPRGLDAPLEASGTFAITSSEPGGGLFFGWFNSDQPGGSGRPIGSFGLNFGSERSGGRLAVRMINRLNKSTGVTVTERIRKNKPTSIRNDGTRYRWTLKYDPAANEGNGRFTFTISSNAKVREDFEGRIIAADLPPGFKQEGAQFDRFGLMNNLKGGGGMQVYFDDLEFDGRAEDFAHDPQWIGSGNRVRFQDRERPGAHDFGYSATSRLAGGAPGEIGGNLWRTGEGWSYYADRIGPLTLEHRIEARGKVQLVTGGPDSAMCLGFFSSARREGAPPDHAGDFLGVRIGGPTRIGHYFAPVYATAKGTPGKLEPAPILTPARTYEWSFRYDPTANENRGAIELTLGTESVTLLLKPGRKAEGARFDRFGLFTTHPGGQMVRIFIDDVTYTAGP